MELGIATFADVGRDPSTGRLITPEQRLADLLEEAELAEQVGLDVFGLGEHHRPDYAVSAPAVALAAIAARTERIRLTSAVTVLSSDDPVRVFQQFSTLDLLSHGRAEIMAGRGSFTESFPLFGQDLKDYDDLYEEKLDLLLRLRASEHVTWSGRHRAPLEDAGVYPRPVQDPLPVWVAVGGTPQSVARAGLLGLPLTIAILSGGFERYVPLVDLYHQALEHAGHDRSVGRVGINTHTWVAPTSKQAGDELWPAYGPMMNRIGRERGWPPMTREAFDAQRSGLHALGVGSPEELTAKILHAHELFGNDRYIGQFSLGGMPHEQVLKAIELFGTEVAPAVRAEVARRTAPATA
jgi:probable LLM family oxidoreductase